MLEIKNLVKEYKKKKAVNHLDLKLKKGSCAVLLGPNGAGKSTVIKSIAGLLRYDGEILFDGKDTRDLSVKAKMAYIPEIPNLYDGLTVYEHLGFIQRAYRLPKEGIEEKIETLLKRFDLWEHKDKLGDELSKGMKQKVSICCALLTNPEFVMLDEPMIGLDPMGIRILKEEINRLRNEGITLLLSTHMLEMVEGLWDEVFIMHQGALVGKYDKSSVDAKELEEIFFNTIGEVKANESTAIFNNNSN